MSVSKVRVLEPDSVELDLHSAVLLYASIRGDVYATIHSIHDHPSGRLLGAGVPASKDALAEFAKAVSDATSFGGMIPENLLYTAPNAIGWWRPSHRRRVWFKSSDKAIGQMSAVVTHPPLFFFVRSNSWYVAALRENQRPTAATKLYKAPYFNVWGNDEICTGNIDLPGNASADAIEAYEDAFFRSRFTHSNQSKLVKYPGGATALWGEQLRAPEKNLLTAAILLPTKETISQFITRVTLEKLR